MPETFRQRSRYADNCPHCQAENEDICPIACRMTRREFFHQRECHWWEGALTRYRVRYVNPATGRVKGDSLRAFDEEDARRRLAEKGIVDIRLIEVDEPPATDRQIAYLRSIGRLVRGPLTCDEASDLLTNYKRGREPAEERERAFARLFKVSVTRFASKATIYETIAVELANRNCLRDLALWFVFRVYRDLCDREAVAVIDWPADPRLSEVADAFLNAPDAVSSMFRDEDKSGGWRWFGSYSPVPGQVYYGADRGTECYRTARDLLVRHGLVNEPAAPKRAGAGRHQGAALPAGHEGAPNNAEGGALGWLRRLFGF